VQKPIRSVEEFYAHALALEREAAERYSEFETWFFDRGEEVLAGLCRNLARMENEHFMELVRASRHLSLPSIDGAGYQWLESGSPEAAAREVFYRVAEPRHLLEIALHAECNALAFFEWVARSTPDASIRALAQGMAAEEQQHVEWVQKALEHRPSRSIDWEKLLA
jgi:rubrerythrin